MRCPKCNSKLGVTDSVHNDKENETYRRKICRKCKHIFYTVEYEVIQNETFKKAWSENYRKHNKKEKNENGDD